MNDLNLRTETTSESLANNGEGLLSRHGGLGAAVRGLRNAVAATAALVALGGTAQAAETKDATDTCSVLGENCFTDCPKGTVPTSYMRGDKVTMLCVKEGASKRLREEKTALREEIARLQELLQSREERIKSLEETLMARDSEILRLKAEIVELNALLEECKRGLKEIERQLREIVDAPAVDGPVSQEAPLDITVGGKVTSVVAGPSDLAYTHVLARVAVTGDGTDGVFGEVAVLGGVAVLESCGNAPALGGEVNVGWRKGAIAVVGGVQVLHTWKPKGFDIPEQGSWSVLPQGGVRVYVDGFTFEVGAAVSIGEDLGMITFEPQSELTVVFSGNHRF
ncbi:hypothetical protein CVV38_03455 [Candidatus Peregrinibacteria bacterium HGW-Peregrinibacteria-1]|jgi:hypothetical protein|nr:MAG: hypothetical protein CVV38_03455 [Candidatus Peregrinibacteria bacterium HGW-Peregrinibacteria-1]